MQLSHFLPLLKKTFPPMEIQSTTPFHGVRFALCGFESSNQDEIRSKLVDGGAVDVGQYGPNCTHVIVHNLLFDDPVCAAATHDGKVLVTALWVRHSLDVGEPVDASLVMYRPVKDLSGIPAAKCLVMCLTGYQGKDRQDIRTMVSLMGAQFSKPLLSKRVTHLICYKFEGEKYELAMRLKKVKLVNHRWLEDCLKAWEILPEDDYGKSGYEQEMEVEAAKDSENEREDFNVLQIGEGNKSACPLGLQNRLLESHESPILGQKISPLNQTEDISTSAHVNNVVVGKEDHVLNSTHVTQVDQQPSRLQDNEGTKDAKSSGLHVPNISGSKRPADSNGSKYGSLSNPRKSPRKSGVSLHSTDGGSKYGAKHSGIDSIHASVTVDGSRSNNGQTQSSIGKSAICSKQFIPEPRIVNSAKEESPPIHQQSVGILSVENNVSEEVTKFENSKLELSFAADEPNTRSPMKKSVRKKTLGSRSRLKLGSSANKKGSICHSGTSPLVNTSVHEENETPADPTEAFEASRHESSVLDVSRSHNQPNDILIQFENAANDVADAMDDDTEAPAELEMVENNDVKCMEAELSPPAKATEEAQGIADTVVRNESSNATSVEMKENGGSVLGSGTTKKKLTKQKKAVGTKTRKTPDKMNEQGGLVSEVEAAEEKSTKQKKAIGTKIRKAPDTTNEQGGSVSRTEAAKEKLTKQKKAVGTETIKKPELNVLDVLSPKLAVNTEKDGGRQKENFLAAAWFILTGHKLQKKEFQNIIKRMKVRLCKDSHHWSFQATHLIVPEPVHRVEKFFAAAASGSWILKSDYLTASDQAGKLLPEEPFELHKSGLSEDGAIYMEAPRKWRLLKERTGHGAFYGTRFIIYGECSSQLLESLKCAIKAGDGTIVATSPPYTSVLKSGVDFTIVFPDMPRDDIWVQEFLNHNIPCVLADYLVEYVCKPGFPLDKHVLYNTHKWAAKSFANMVSLSEEVVGKEDIPSTPEELVMHDDLMCTACGSTDREDVMLLCGTEDGSAGCGAGMHIDCCNPPLSEVPEEDWFCPTCVGVRAHNKTTGTDKRKKSSKSSKR